MKRTALLTVLAMAPALAGADQVFLKGGGEVRGEIVERRADALVLEVGPGRITLAVSRVERVVSSSTDLGLFRARASALAAGDLGGWLRLAAWARSRDLLTQAREAYEHVLSVDPANRAAHAALGHVEVAGAWMSFAEANRTRGLVEIDGLWVSPEERQAILAERAAVAEERHAVREAESRAREAEARVREAEARARTAEAEARLAEEPVTSGIPYPYVFGGGGYYPGPYPPYDPFPPGVVVPEPLPPPVLVVKPYRPPRGGMVTEPRRNHGRDGGHDRGRHRDGGNHGGRQGDGGSQRGSRGKS